MKVTLFFSREDIQKILGGIVLKEANKHGHTSDLRSSITVFVGDQQLPLTELNLSVHAQIEVG